MSGIARIAIVATACVVLSACAYRPLKAPCGPDEGDPPLAYTDPPSAVALPEPLRALDACGPMKPI